SQRFNPPFPAQPVRIVSTRSSNSDQPGFKTDLNMALMSA
ncbi:uncharacterized protein METZ01_LOCUS362037, partial [marine metagenome]